MVAPTAVNGTGPATTAAGALAAAIGLYYLLAVATGDEKFKRNTGTSPFPPLPINLPHRGES